jgi:hypothetical protein
MRSKWIITAILALQIAPLPSAAVATFYTDRASWLAASGSPTFSEDFSSFTEDTPFQTAPVALAGMSIAQEGSGNFRNTIDVGPDFDFTDNNGTNHASLFTNKSGGPTPMIQVRITFTAPVNAFGFDHWVAADAEGARLEIYDGALLVGAHDLDNAFGGFLGYVLSLGESATSVLFVSVQNLGAPGDPGEGFGIDSLAGVAVPELGALPLLMFGLFALVRRRR